MSEYQYYEFCSISSPLQPDARKELHSLSSRARVGTHGASYVYHYSDFRGKPKELLLKYFDAFFYISNWGNMQLQFKYRNDQVDMKEIEKYCIEDAICCEQYGQYTVLDIDLNNEEGDGWIEGEGLLPRLLPLYDEIKARDYQALALASAIEDEFSGEAEHTLKSVIAPMTLSSAQQALLESAGY